MDTSNRPGETLSPKVATITGRGKFGCDELTAEEWVSLVKIALAEARPYLDYTPYFRSLNVDGIEIFSFRLTRTDRQRSGHFSVDKMKDDLRLSFEKYTDAVTTFIINMQQVLQICEVNIPGRDSVSAKIMLTKKGELAIIECERVEGDKLSQVFPEIKKAYLLDNDEALLHVFKTYTQLGPMTLMVLSYVLNTTYNDRFVRLQCMGRAGEKVESFIRAIEMDGRLVINHQWGIMGLSKKTEEQPSV